MELYIGTKLRQLRQERGITQEELAAHIGISFQAISKWERGDGYPDIKMLPVLAHYYAVTVDELLGMNELAMQRKYEEYNQQWDLQNQNGLHAENAVLMEQALKEYPNDDLLLVQLSTSLEKLEGTEEQKQEWLKRSIEIQEQILKYGKDPKVKSAVQSNICFAYLKNGDRKRAIEEAEKLPNLYKTRENTLIYMLEGEEQKALASEAMEALKWSIGLHLQVLGEDVGKMWIRELSTSLYGF